MAQTKRRHVLGRGLRRLLRLYESKVPVARAASERCGLTFAAFFCHTLETGFKGSWSRSIKESSNDGSLKAGLSREPRVPNICTRKTRPSSPSSLAHKPLLVLGSRRRVVLEIVPFELSVPRGVL